MTKKLTLTQRKARKKAHETFLIGTRLAPRDALRFDDSPAYDEMRSNWSPYRTPRDLQGRGTSEL